MTNASSASTASRKVRHDLHRATDVTEFNALLADTGIDIIAMIAEHVVPGCQLGVLLVGSLAEGTGTASSDVDVLVLLQSPQDLQVPPGTVVIDAGPVREVLRYINGIEVNLSFLIRENLARALDAFIAISPALYNPKQLKILPLLDDSDVRIMHRLRVGWPLAGTEVVLTWRDELLVDLLPVYSSIRNYVEMNEYVEDVDSVMGGPPGCVHFIAALAARHGMQALLAQEGYASPNVKWLFHWCEAVESTELRELLGNGAALLGRSPATDPDHKLVQELVQFQARVKEHLERTPELTRAIAFLADEINYVDLAR